MTAPPDAEPCESRGRPDTTTNSQPGPITPPEPFTESFTSLFDRNFADVHGYIARRLGTDIADDVASETFLTAFRLRARYDPARGDRRAWLFGIATNLMRRHRRTEVRSYRALARLAPSEAAPGHEDYEDRVADRLNALGMRGKLSAALARLSQGDRDVLLLIALAELTYDQTAQALGISYGTVCSRLNRARRKVRTALGGDPTQLDKEPIP